VVEIRDAEGKWYPFPHAHGHRAAARLDAKVALGDYGHPYRVRVVRYVPESK
jgi:hypothetical protein